MAPAPREYPRVEAFLSELTQAGIEKSFIRSLPRANNTTLWSSSQGAYEQHAWSGGFNVASVDLIAMVVSDAGLASTEPKWWNASPIGCLLLGAQPRGGWQVLQRAVQWGTDHWAHCFGVDCKVSVLYEYFSCSIRNRLEVWESRNFLSPMEEHDDSAADETVVEVLNGTSPDEEKNKPSIVQLDDKAASVDNVKEDTTKALPSPQIQPLISQSNTDNSNGTPRRRESAAKLKKAGDSLWHNIDRGVRGRFAIKRPTKLTDGSRGGQAFICDFLKPAHGQAYSVEEQSRMQLLSVILVAAGLGVADTPEDFLGVLSEDFGLNDRLGSTFRRLLPCLIVANLLIIGLTASVFYALWERNIFGLHAPYAIQICSLASWASGATGLMMMGGNPRVTITSNHPAPKHVQDRLEALSGDYTPVPFGSLHGSVFVEDRGVCHVPTEILHSVCRWRLRLTRNWKWYCAMIWFLLFLLISIVLQIAGSKIATIRSEILSIVWLIFTSLLRGAGLSGPEKWMIPPWKRRHGAVYAVKLQGQIQSRVSASET